MFGLGGPSRQSLQDITCKIAWPGESSSADAVVADVDKYFNSLNKSDWAEHAYNLLTVAVEVDNVDVKIIKRLLSYGANPNKFDSDGYYTPFLKACTRPRNNAVMQALIEEGADVNSKDFWNRGALCTAVRHSRDDIRDTETIKCFLNAEVD